MKLLIVVLVCSLVALSVAFVPQARMSSRNSGALRAFDGSTLAKLEEIHEKYSRLANVDSADADAERDSLAEIAEKYGTYKEVKTLMGKLRMMWRSEASESRKSRQLKSFVDLYKGQLELEELLKEKLGLPFTKEIVPISELEGVTAAEAKVAELENELERVTYKIPVGMSTRDERFFGNPQHRVPQLP
jgi:DNA repair exonuclease SbcCD ATPase subunit